MDLEYEYSQNELEKTLEFLCIIKNIYIDLSKRNFEIDNFDEIIVFLKSSASSSYPPFSHIIYPLKERKTSDNINLSPFNKIQFVILRQMSLLYSNFGNIFDLQS